MERRVDPSPPLLPPALAPGHQQRIANQMDEFQARKELERCQVSGFQKGMARFQINGFRQSFDVLALFGQASPNAVEPSGIGVKDGGAEQGWVAPIKEGLVPAGAAGNVLSE